MKDAVTTVVVHVTRQHSQSLLNVGQDLGRASPVPVVVMRRDADVAVVCALPAAVVAVDRSALAPANRRAAPATTLAAPEIRG